MLQSEAGLQVERGPLAGKVAVVTGATGGLGAIICKNLARAGAFVVVGYNKNSTEAAHIAEALSGAGHMAVSLPVTDSAALAAAAKMIKAQLGRVDIVVNCAGITRYVEHHNLDDLDDTLIDAILVTNVRGPIAVIRAFRSLLAHDSQGLVVNISSIAARTAMGSNIAYCASKAALDNLTQSLARAMAPHIRVVSVAPGLTDTDFVKSIDPQWRAAQAAHTPLGRLARPEDVADAVLAAATHLKFSTGFVLPVDGGRSLL